MTCRGGCHCGRIAFEVEGEQAMAAVNVRCLAGVEPTELNIRHVDGASL